MLPLPEHFGQPGRKASEAERVVADKVAEMERILADMIGKQGAKILGSKPEDSGEEVERVRVKDPDDKIEGDPEGIDTAKGELDEEHYNWRDGGGAEGDAEGDGDDGEAEAEGDGDAEGEAEGDGDAEGEGDGESDAEGEGKDGSGEAEGDDGDEGGDGEAEGEGEESEQDAPPPPDLPEGQHEVFASLLIQGMRRVREVEASLAYMMEILGVPMPEDQD